MSKRWKNLPTTIRLRLLILTALLIGALIPAAWSVSRTGDWEGLAANFSTEMAGAAITFILLDWIIGGRERREEHHQETEFQKSDLTARMSSSVREVALAAADELRHNGWMMDGTLRGACLRRADLQSADLSKSDLADANLHRVSLQNADLWAANLHRADLSGAWLTNARLWQAQMMEANLWQARLHKADLREANLREAVMNETRLQEANLRGANFEGALLQDAKLDKAQFDTTTILPDGQHWTPTTDLTRFTNPQHPDFWQPEILPQAALSLKLQRPN